MLTPRKIHQMKFSHAFKGYNPKEVDNFLSKVVSEYETLFQENSVLKERLAQLEKDLQNQSADLSQTHELITLTKEALEKIKGAAEYEVQTILKSAKLKGEEIIQQAKDEANQILQKIGVLKEEEGRIRYRLKVLLETGLELIDKHDYGDTIDRFFEDKKEAAIGSDDTLEPESAQDF